jgi:RES domain-containing protein
MSFWRITQREFADSAFSGRGAEIYGGRFNTPGKRAVYASDHLSLSVLEMLVQVNSREYLQNFICIPFDLDEKYIKTVNSKDLPKGWDTIPYSSVSQEYGYLWLESKMSVALRVPSIVIPQEYNLILNPDHKHFKKLKIGKPIRVPLDRRIKVN